MFIHTLKMESEKFCLNNYDCIGFDLDCTLAEYNLKELMKLIYNLLADYLINKKSYKSEFLQRSFEEDEYFLQKGLLLDLKRGNILKLSESGVILKASHGTKHLSAECITQEYGPNRSFIAVEKFFRDPLSIINTPYEKVLRASLDCFDMPCIILFARMVDHLDEINKSVSTEYNIWPDILEGLYYLYSKNHFETGVGGFFSALQQNPSKFYKKWDLEKLNWLKEVKSKKFTFLLTGSFIDFANLTATTCIGKNWKEYFDVIICYARKPFFFCSGRPFINVENGKETEAVEEGKLTTNSVYSQGNWEDLKALVSKHTNNKQPKCLYIGDNLIQDVFSPVHFQCCDSVAVSTELNDQFKFSKFWDSYFVNADQTNSYWNYLIKTHAKICISSLDVFTKNPLDYHYVCLKQNQSTDITESNGYYMAKNF